MNDLLGKKKEAPPNSLLIQGELVNDEMSFTNKFAEFFSSVGQNVQAQGLVNFNNDLLEDINLWMIEELEMKLNFSLVLEMKFLKL